MNALNWLSDWYKLNCNGDWEHHYIIKIKRLDNPGWSIIIDLEDSISPLKNFPWKLIEKSDHDWYGFKVENDKFDAAGDPSKLEFLINLFKEFVETEGIDNS